MRCAAAGNLFTLKMATSGSDSSSHTTAAHPAANTVATSDSPVAVANWESG